VSADPDAAWWLRCTACGETFAWQQLVRGCPACRAAPVAAVLETVFAPDRAPAPLKRRAGRGLARYRDLLPGLADPYWITIGEGGTPLLRSRRIGPRLDLGRLYFKLEGANPTGSFKDRYVCVSVNLARRFGCRRIAVSSTGNLGVAVAAYGAAAGLGALFICLEDTPPAVLARARLHGATLLATSPEDRQALFEIVAERPGCFPIGLFLRRPVQNPYGVEGYKSLAYELIEDLGAAPAAVVFPCARGNGLFGAWKGFVEALRWGWAERVPQMVGCQPQGANSLELSLAAGAEEALELPPIKSLAFSAAETVASDQALLAIRQSAGAAFSASEAEIREAVLELAREGLAVEPSAALPVACLPKLIEAELVDRSAPIVCVLTAQAANAPDAIPVERPAPEILPAERARVHAFLDRHGF
jgi:threonine synthase